MASSERGLTTPVLSHQERNWPIKIKGLNGGNGRNVEWIDRSIFHLIPENFDFDEPATDSGHTVSVLLPSDASRSGGWVAGHALLACQQHRSRVDSPARSHETQLGNARFRHILHKGTISGSAGSTAKEGMPSSQ